MTTTGQYTWPQTVTVGLEGLTCGVCSVPFAMPANLLDLARTVTVGSGAGDDQH